MSKVLCYPFVSGIKMITCDYELHDKHGYYLFASSITYYGEISACMIKLANFV